MSSTSEVTDATLIPYRAWTLNPLAFFAIRVLWSHSTAAVAPRLRPSHTSAGAKIAEASAVLTIRSAPNSG